MTLEFFHGSTPWRKYQLLVIPGSTSDKRKYYG